MHIAISLRCSRISTSDCLCFTTIGNKWLLIHQKHRNGVIWILSWEPFGKSLLPETSIARRCQPNEGMSLRTSIFHVTKRIHRNLRIPAPVEMCRTCKTVETLEGDANTTPWTSCPGSPRQNKDWSWSIPHSQEPKFGFLDAQTSFHHHIDLFYVSGVVWAPPSASNRFPETEVFTHQLIHPFL